MISQIYSNKKNDLFKREEEYLLLDFVIDASFDEHAGDVFGDGLLGHIFNPAVLAVSIQFQKNLLVFGSKDHVYRRIIKAQLSH